MTRPEFLHATKPVPASLFGYRLALGAASLRCFSMQAVLYVPGYNLLKSQIPSDTRREAGEIISVSVYALIHFSSFSLLGEQEAFPGSQRALCSRVDGIQPCSIPAAPLHHLQSCSSLTVASGARLFPLPWESKRHPEDAEFFPVASGCPSLPQLGFRGWRILGINFRNRCQIQQAPCRGYLGRIPRSSAEEGSRPRCVSFIYIFH